jgi:DNA-directed RNA polymerase specialized sigma24 family protein
MLEDQEFQDLLRRLRQGDEEAAARLVREFEPEIRRLYRVQFQDARLRRVFDSADILQSVLANFFLQAAGGRLEVRHPAELLKLLRKMVHNKYLDKVAYQRAGRRDVRRLEASLDALHAVADGGASPSELVADLEVLELVVSRLTPEERWLVEQRVRGRPWEELAAERGAGAEALRKQHARALERVRRELGLGGPAGG